MVGLLGGPAPARAERLPLTRYSASDGLAGDSVLSAIEDRRGFLWFGTGSGLSRFDGRSFKNFGASHGLGEPVFDLREDADGSFLVGTYHDLYRFDPLSEGRFEPLVRDPPPVNWTGVRTLRDRRGVLWLIADGLYRLEGDPKTPALVRVRPDVVGSTGGMGALLEDSGGNLWAGLLGLARFTPGGAVLRVEPSDGTRFERVNSIAEDDDGRIWVGSEKGVCLVAMPAPADGRTTCDPFPSSPPVRAFATRVLARAGGGVWAGTDDGVLEIDASRGVVRTIGRRQGLRSTLSTKPLLVDSAGDLWISPADAGLARLARSGVVSYGPDEGLEQPRVTSIFRTQSGELVVAGTGHVLHRFDGGAFTPVHPALPALPAQLVRGWYQYDLQDHEGSWWIPAGDGIVRFPPTRRVDDLARARPVAVYTEQDGLPGKGVYRLFEDSRGDIWIGTSRSSGVMLGRWERATGTFHRYGESEGVPENAPRAFVEDARGNLWIGFYLGQLVRYRDGRFTSMMETHREGEDGVYGFLIDRKRRLWIATGARGACRIDDPSADDPGWTCLTVANGLSTNSIRTIAEGPDGRFYFGTPSGIDAWEEGADRVRHLGIADGLPHAQVGVSYSDPELGLWFGTLDGVARYQPEAHRREDAPPPSVRIDGLLVAGVARPLAAAGVEAVSDLVLGTREDRLQIDYVGPNRNPGDVVRYQYRLAETDPWSRPTRDRSVLFPGLSPGRYRFEVRAVDGAGRPSPEAAVVAFRVMAPIWRRGWFLATAVVAVLGAIAAAHRVHVSRLLALERQRARIAMDLHDEMGSGLGSIGLLADVAASETTDAGRRRGLLEQIAETASELGTSLTDIVRSLHEREMSAESLARHLAARARRMLPGPSPRLVTVFPDSWPRADLSMPVRRNALLVGLEALHNAARHSGAGSIVLELAAEGRRWRLSVRDDGIGMNGAPSGGPESSSGGPGDPARRTQGPTKAGGGFGIEAMKRRAWEIGATLEIESEPGKGTSVTLLFDPRAEDRRL